MQNKKLGDLAELRFQLLAFENGFIVSKPFGDNTRYDFVIDQKGTLSRIQVRATNTTVRGGYRISLGHGAKSKTPYTSKDIDFVLAYIFPKNIWYIIPVEIIKNKKSILLRPDDENDPLRYFKEIWDFDGKQTKEPSFSGGVYKTKYGYQVRFGPKLTRRFKEESEANLFWETLKQIAPLIKK